MRLAGSKYLKYYLLLLIVLIICMIHHSQNGWRLIPRTTTFQESLKDNLTYNEKRVIVGATVRKALKEAALLNLTAMDKVYKQEIENKEMGDEKEEEDGGGAGHEKIQKTLPFKEDQGFIGTKDTVDVYQEPKKDENNSHPIKWIPSKEGVVEKNERVIELTKEKESDPEILLKDRLKLVAVNYTLPVTIHMDEEIMAGDLYSLVSENFETCAKYCRNEPKCASWSFSFPNKLCYLKQLHTIARKNNNSCYGVIHEDCGQLKEESMCSSYTFCSWCLYSDGQNGICIGKTDALRFACPSLKSDESTPNLNYKIGIVSMFVGAIRHNFYNMTSNLKRIYAETQGYGYHEVSEEQAMDVLKKAPDLKQDFQKRRKQFLKLLALLKYFDRYDWLFWQDADSFFLNHNFRLTDIIDTTGQYDAVFAAYTHNSSIRHDGIVNSGNFLIKTSNFGSQLLKLAFNRSDQFGDQNGLILTLLKNPELRNRTKFVSHRMMNSMPESDYSLTDFIIHFPGPGKYKIPILEKMSHLVIYKTNTTMDKGNQPKIQQVLGQPVKEDLNKS